jgi:hypothetical protein
MDQQARGSAPKYDLHLEFRFQHISRGPNTTDWQEPSLTRVISRSWHFF